MANSKIFQILFFLIVISCNMDLHASSCSQKGWHSLQKSNTNFIKNPIYSIERSMLIEGQNPHCIILGCSDSRAPPEIIFNRGLGELFVTRVAGNIADDVVVDSIEYAVSHFNVSTIVVMGHTGCGAVIGALKHLKKNHGKIDSPSSGHLNAVLIPIETAIIEAGIDIYASNALELSIKANVSYVAKQLLKKSSIISKNFLDRKLIVVGAEYSLETGKVTELFILDGCTKEAGNNK